MDEATPHLHIDFVPYTTGSKRGLDTRVSLKQALLLLGFKGGARRETELNQWVVYEKEQLAAVMLEHGLSGRRKATHEKHLSVLDFEKGAGKGSCRTGNEKSGIAGRKRYFSRNQRRFA